MHSRDQAVRIVLGLASVLHLAGCRRIELAQRDCAQVTYVNRDLGAWAVLLKRGQETNVPLAPDWTGLPYELEANRRSIEEAESYCLAHGGCPPNSLMTSLYSYRVSLLQMQMQRLATAESMQDNEADAAVCLGDERRKVDKQLNREKQRRASMLAKWTQHGVREAEGNEFVVRLSGLCLAASSSRTAGCIACSEAIWEYGETVHSHVVDCLRQAAVSDDQFGASPLEKSSRSHCLLQFDRDMAACGSEPGWQYRMTPSALGPGFESRLTKSCGREQSLIAFEPDGTLALVVATAALQDYVSNDGVPPADDLRVGTPQVSVRLHEGRALGTECGVQESRGPFGPQVYRTWTGVSGIVRLEIGERLRPLGHGVKLKPARVVARMEDVVLRDGEDPAAKIGIPSFEIEVVLDLWQRQRGTPLPD